MNLKNLNGLMEHSSSMLFKKSLGQKVLSHKKARDFQLWNSSFLILSRSLIVF